MSLHFDLVDGALSADFTIVQPPVALHDLAPGPLYEMKEDSGADFFLANDVRGENIFGASVAFVTAGIGVVVAKSVVTLSAEPLDTIVTVGFGAE